MTKWFCSLLLLSSSTVLTTLQGWGTSDYVIPSLQPPAHQAPPSSISFPLNEDQEWFVKPSLLVWRPYQDDIDSGFTIAVPASSLSTISVQKNKTQNVDFSWGTGVRLTIGRYLPNHEQWDVTLGSTFFYSNTDQTIRVKNGLSGLNGGFPSESKLITEGWNPSLLGVGNKTELNWRINYFTWDLAVGRLFSLTPRIVVHPYLCLRTLLVYEKYSNRNKSFDIANNAVILRNTSFKAENTTWGIGPRLGSDFAFSFGHGWSFMAGLSGSIVMGRNDISEKIEGFIPQAGALSTPAELKIQDADTVMRSNLEGSIGLGWEKWVRKHSVRIAPSFVFEVTEWFLINNWAATNRTSANGSPDWGMNSSRRMGDLGFLGFTLNLQLDF